MSQNNSPASQQQKSNRLTLFIFWAYVGMPLIWGVWSTLKKAMSLFH